MAGNRRPVLGSYPTAPVLEKAVDGMASGQIRRYRRSGSHSVRPGSQLRILRAAHAYWGDGHDELSNLANDPNQPSGSDEIQEEPPGLVERGVSKAVPVFQPAANGNPA